MFRTSKIPARHQTRADGLWVVYHISDGHTPAGITTPEQADEHRASYRAKCDTRRNGKVLETIDENGGWTLLQSFASINKAKASTSNRRYAV